MKVASVWRTIMGYIWQNSDGDWQMKQAIQDYATTGMGYLYAYIDRESDFGRGDVKFTYVDPFRVYASPSSRDRWFSDSDGIILSTILTGEQAVNLYPELGDRVDPETGETRQFSGMPIRIPDFAAAMDDVYMKNVDNVSSLANLEDYVYGGGADSALGFYINSPGGRSHINMIAQQVSSQDSEGQDVRSFNRLNEEQKERVQTMLNDELFNAGKRYLKTSGTTGLPDRMQGKAVLDSGQNQTTLTDGNPDTEDQVMVTFDDQVDNSRIDNQLTLMYESDRDIPVLDIKTGTMERGSGKMVSSSDLLGAKLTGVIGPNGLPVIQLEMKPDKDRTKGGFVYTEMQAEDAGTLAANLGEFKAQLLQDATTMRTRTNAAPLFGAAYEPGLNAWATGDSEDVYDAASIGLEIRKENGMFHFYNKSGKHMKNKSGDPVAFGSIREVQIAIGNQILQIS